MTEKVVKDGFALAEEEMRKKQVEEVKRIVLKTLEKIKDQEKIREDAIDKIKILKMDIDDLKDGKIDRIVERQEKDPKATQISVVTIIKEIHHHENPWYVPYRIIWHEPYIPYLPYINTYDSLATVNNGSQLMAANILAKYSNTITNSVAKDAVIGIYTLDNGEIVNLR